LPELNTSHIYEQTKDVLSSCNMPEVAKQRNHRCARLRGK